MKKIIRYVLLICVVFSLCSCSSRHIKQINLDEFKEKIKNKDTFALFIGNEDCSHCVAYKPTLEKVLKKYNIKIYHIDNNKLSEKEYNELKSYVYISGTPTIIFFEKGNEESTLSRIVGETSYEDTVEKFKENGYIKK